jgi:hypothetical protein
MKTYMIGYDLNKPRANDDYKNLIEAIKAYGTFWHFFDSTWIIKTDDNPIVIRDNLKAHIDNGDELILVRLQGDWGTVGIDEKGIKWLQDHMSLV